MIIIYKKLIIVFSILISISISVLIFLFVPLLNDYEQNKTLLTKKINEQNINFQKISYLQKTHKDSSNFQSTVNTVNDLWPNDGEISKFIVQAEGLTKEMNLVIDSFSIDEKGPVKKTSTDGEGSQKKSTEAKEQKTQFTITAKASYPVFINFLKKMENLARLNSTSAIDLSILDGGNLNIRVVGNIFYGK